MHLALVEPIHPKLHGLSYQGYYPIYCFSVIEFYHFWNTIKEILTLHCQKYSYNQRHYTKLEIISYEDVQTENGLIIHLAIIKTFWLRIFQRCWREKHKIIQQRKNPKSLFHRSITGKFL